MARIAAVLAGLAALGGVVPLLILDRAGSAITDRSGNTIQARA